MIFLEKGPITIKSNAHGNISFAAILVNNTSLYSLIIAKAKLGLLLH